MRGLLTLMVIGLLVVLIATATQPVPFGTAASDSMAPTIEEGATFLAIPPALFGGVDVNDIAVYQGMDGWTVHRIVSIEDGAAITAGDANPMTDQQTGAPPLSVGSVVGIVPTIGGRPLATTVGLPGITRWELGVIGGAIAIWAQLSSHRATSISPVHIGLLAVVVVTFAWVITPSIETSATATIRNGGPLPSLLIAESSGYSTMMWPTDRFAEAHSGVRTIPAIAPPSLISRIATVDHRLAVAVAAIITGSFVGGIAAVIGRWVGR